MSSSLSLDEFLELAKNQARVSVHQTVAADRLTPISIVQSLEDQLGTAAILESGLQHQQNGRYSFIAYNPIASIEVRNAVITTQIGQRKKISTRDPFIELRELTQLMRCDGASQKITQLHGAIGFLSYDAIRLTEKIPDRHHHAHALPEIFFNFYEIVLMFDHRSQNLVISVACEIHNCAENDFANAHEKIQKIISALQQPLTTQITPHKKSQVHLPETDISDEEFILMVEKAQHYIHQGDAFQIVLSRCFDVQYDVSTFAIYRALRRISPAPYMFYIPTPFGVLTGASPETLIRVQDGEITINPIAGTRARTSDSKDEEIERDLLHDEKEKAEHMMLVDLARNDLGRICRPGSIKINELMHVKHYSHISHITSTISGKLSEKHDALDALRSSFPAGTLSGAPKIRAMELIDEIEKSKRGIYGGAICRFDFHGNFDSCIAIRMAVLKNGIARIRTGAGIVNDSNPMTEANETRQKAQSMLNAIKYAQEEFV